MNRIGRKKTVLLSNLITIIAMFIPLIGYTFFMALIAFALLGIANTILQVSLNPLLTNVVKGDKLTSSLTAGQFVKAISSFSAPFIAAFAAAQLGSWQYVFPIYAVITLLSTIWLMATSIPEEKVEGKASSFGSVLGILKDKTILLLFLGILFVVGVDVGVNTASSKILMERCGLSSLDAGYGPSVYFAFRTLGAFPGSFLPGQILVGKILQDKYCNCRCCFVRVDFCWRENSCIRYFRSCWIYHCQRFSDHLRNGDSVAARQSQ